MCVMLWQGKGERGGRVGRGVSTIPLWCDGASGGGAMDKSGMLVPHAFPNAQTFMETGQKSRPFSPWIPPPDQSVRYTCEG